MNLRDVSGRDQTKEDYRMDGAELEMKRELPGLTERADAGENYARLNIVTAVSIICLCELFSLFPPFPKYHLDI